MNKLILSLALVFLCNNAFSFSVTAEKEVDSESISTSGINFKADKNDLGRAWLEVSVDADDIDDLWTYTEKIKLPGLSFDTSSNKIILQNGIETVACADVRVKTTRNIFTRRTTVRHHVVPTKKCLVSATLDSREVVIDTGFDLVRKKATYLVVSIEAQK